MKEFHIINVGVSIITNYQKVQEELKDKKLADNEFWIDFLKNPKKLDEIYNFVCKDPKKYSAELNSFLRKIENSKNKIEVYFTGTKTPVNEICVRTLERFMRDKGFTVYVSKEFPGYFMETYTGEDRIKSFTHGISDMLDHLIRLANRKKEEGYKVFFNPTGGFKAHVIACALAGFMTYSEVYYFHEEFEDVITFPPLFYIPKGREIDLLKILADKKPRSGKECEEIFKEYEKEIERLILYNLIEDEKDDTGRIFRIKILNKGELIVKEFQERKL
ncbi:putative CRISPR-associated protein [Caldisericum exile]|uniref:putative CRISPR-associated protein n=1 Tax=Caldisericum exile TaxID=693075 RepID=UPI003C752876